MVPAVVASSTEPVAVFDSPSASTAPAGDAVTAPAVSTTSARPDASGSWASDRLPTLSACPAVTPCERGASPGPSVGAGRPSGDPGDPGSSIGGSVRSPSRRGAASPCRLSVSDADAGRSAGTVKLADGADPVAADRAPSVAGSSRTEAGSEADESGAVTEAADAATDLAAATRLDFRLKKHTRVTLRSTDCSASSKRRPQGDRIHSSSVLRSARRAAMSFDGVESERCPKSLPAPWAIRRSGFHVKQCDAPVEWSASSPVKLPALALRGGHNACLATPRPGGTISGTPSAPSATWPSASEGFGRLAGWPTGWLADWPTGWLIGWLAESRH